MGASTEVNGGWVRVGMGSGWGWDQGRQWGKGYGHGTEVRV